MSETPFGVPSTSLSDTLRLVIRRGPDVGKTFPITEPRTSIGRDRNNDIRLDDGTVSLHHAELDIRDHRYTIKDVGSLVGTYLNRHLIDSAELVDGDEVWIGKFRLSFQTGATAV